MDSVTQQPIPVRVRLTRGSHVVNVLPENAIAVMYGHWDHADGYGFQPDSSFYVDGGFELELPEGEYSISLSKGIEYLDEKHTIHVTASSSITKTYSLNRWISMPSRGWYSADDHIHVRRSPREDPLLMKWIQAEGINIGVLLRMGDFWATYYEQYAWGGKGVYREHNYLLASGQEDPRTPEVGHALGFGASDKVRYRDEYYYYDKVFDRLHELGGITGYAHQAESFHGYRGLMLDGLRKKVDVLEILQFCVSQDPLQTRHYYHLLDLGYAVTAVAGSDFPWCGKDHDNGPPDKNARIGNVRFYSFLNTPLSFTAWKAAVRSGHTFVTSGPMLEFTVNDKLPGDTLFVKQGARLKIKTQAYGHMKQVPLDRLELVVHGKVIASVHAGEPGQSSSLLSFEKDIIVSEGSWMAARAYAGSGQAAHTTPVYVSVDGGGFHNKETLSGYLDLAEQYLKELENEIQHADPNPEFQGWRYKKGLEKRIGATRAVIHQLRAKEN
ncbi:MAG TPA: CehA/McbA family metallohydrolase [Cyclobacteriaceae bacterium]|nr:CehA/McbA family metallohydrolase [Cyclobacteriaceae bacterium]